MNRTGLSEFPCGAPKLVSKGSDSVRLILVWRLILLSNVRIIECEFPLLPSWCVR